MIITLLRAYGLPIILILVAIGLYIIGFNNGKTDCKSEAEAEAAKVIIAQQEAAKQDQEAVIVISNALAKKLDDARKANKKLEGKLYEERQKPAYTSCHYDNDGVQLYRSIIKD